jgi:uncharacterized protein (DUF58 family)
VQRLAKRSLEILSNRAVGAARLSRRVTFSREGWYYLFVVVAVFTGTVVRDSNLMLLLGGMLAGPLLISLWFALRALRNIEIRRELPESVCVGERLVVEISCSNRRSRLANWALLVDDAFQYRGPLTLRRPAPARVLFPFVPPGATCRAVYEGAPPVRGRYVFGPLRLSTRFPLGLMRYEKTIDDRQSLTVWPRMGRLTPDGLQLEQRSEMGSQRTERRQARREADFYGLRDWRSGDSRRWIHWRSTARRGQIVVRQFDESRSQDLLLLVDLWQPAGADPAAGERVETAISFAASLLADTIRRGGRRLALETAGENIYRQQGWASQALLREMLDGLALAEPRRDPLLPAEFLLRLVEIQPPLTALVISTRPLDLAAIWPAGKRPLASLGAGAVKVIDVGSPDLARFFEVPV